MSEHVLPQEKYYRSVGLVQCWLRGTGLPGSTDMADMFSAITRVPADQHEIGAYGNALSAWYSGVRFGDPSLDETLPANVMKWLLEIQEAQAAMLVAPTGAAS